MFRDYHAVSIRTGSGCCQAAQALGDQRFLSDEAPQLPLPDCTMNGRCRCRYRHHTDRREDFRRDVDFGLPERLLTSDDRRNQRGRRQADYA